MYAIVYTKTTHTIRLLHRAKRIWKDWKENKSALFVVTSWTVAGCAWCAPPLMFASPAPPVYPTFAVVFAGQFAGWFAVDFAAAK